LFQPRSENGQQVNDLGNQLSLWWHLVRQSLNQSLKNVRAYAGVVAVTALFALPAFGFVAPKAFL
jgi:hypothetical protein